MRIKEKPFLIGLNTLLLLVLGLEIYLRQIHEYSLASSIKVVLAEPPSRVPRGIPEEKDESSNYVSVRSSDRSNPSGSEHNNSSDSSSNDEKSSSDTTSQNQLGSEPENTHTSDDSGTSPKEQKSGDIAATDKSSSTRPAGEGNQNNRTLPENSTASNASETTGTDGSSKPRIVGYPENRDTENNDLESAKPSDTTNPEEQHNENNEKTNQPNPSQKTESVDKSVTSGDEPNSSSGSDEEETTSRTETDRKTANGSQPEGGDGPKTEENLETGEPEKETVDSNQREDVQKSGDRITETTEKKEELEKRSKNGNKQTETRVSISLNFPDSLDPTTVRCQLIGNLLTPDFRKKHRSLLARPGSLSRKRVKSLYDRYLSQLVKQGKLDRAFDKNNDERSLNYSRTLTLQGRKETRVTGIPEGFYHVQINSGKYSGTSGVYLVTGNGTSQTIKFDIKKTPKLIGFVKDASDGSPIQNATVNIQGTDNILHTSEDGIFTANELKKNQTYQVKIKKEGYKSVASKIGPLNSGNARKRTYLLEKIKIPEKKKPDSTEDRPSSESKTGTLNVQLNNSFTGKESVSLFKIEESTDRKKLVDTIQIEGKEKLSFKGLTTGQYKLEVNGTKNFLQNPGKTFTISPDSIQTTDLELVKGKPVAIRYKDQTSNTRIREPVKTILEAVDEHGNPIPGGTRQVKRSGNGICKGTVHPDAHELIVQSFPGKKYQKRTFRKPAGSFTDLVLKLKNKPKTPVPAFLYIFRKDRERYINLRKTNRSQNIMVHYQIYDLRGNLVFHNSSGADPKSKKPGSDTPMNISKLKPGRYRILGDMKIYDEENSLRSHQVIWNLLEINRENNVNNKAIKPVPSVSINGRLTYPDGSPAADIIVRIPVTTGQTDRIEESGYRYKISTSPSYRNVKTDVEGNFELSGIPADRTISLQFLMPHERAVIELEDGDIPDGTDILLSSQKITTGTSIKKQSLGELTVPRMKGTR